MAIPERTTLPTRLADWFVQITDDGSRTLIRPSDQVAFHSGCGAIAETKHVYLRNSGVQARLKAQAKTRVLEIGLGTGMGMLLTVDTATSFNTSLDFVSFEIDLLPADVIQQLQPNEWVEEKSLVDRFLQFRCELADPIADGDYQWSAESNQKVTIVMGNVYECSFADHGKFHAVFFDPFAPDVNSPLWETGFLQKMHQVLLPGGTLTTYCVKRVVRDNLASVGFDVQRVPGPEGGKREVLIATKQQ